MQLHAVLLDGLLVLVDQSLPQLAIAHSELVTQLLYKQRQLHKGSSEIISTGTYTIQAVVQ